MLQRQPHRALRAHQGHTNTPQRKDLPTGARERDPIMSSGEGLRQANSCWILLGAFTVSAPGELFGRPRRRGACGAPSTCSSSLASSSSKSLSSAAAYSVDISGSASGMMLTLLFAAQTELFQAGINNPGRRSVWLRDSK